MNRRKRLSHVTMCISQHERHEQYTVPVFPLFQAHAPSPLLPLYVSHFGWTVSSTLRRLLLLLVLPISPISFSVNALLSAAIATTSIVPLSAPPMRRPKISIGAELRVGPRLTGRRPTLPRRIPPRHLRGRRSELQSRVRGRLGREGR